MRGPLTLEDTRLQSALSVPVSETAINRSAAAVAWAGCMLPKELERTCNDSRQRQQQQQRFAETQAANLRTPNCQPQTTH